MSNISYHGTSKENAKNLVKAVKVDLGKGELGKGFYTGSSIGIAASWAQIRFREQAVVVEFDIPKERFVQLKPHIVRTKEGVKSIWNSLRDNKETNTFTFGHDYIISPFATIEESGHQYKFESQKSEDELNLCNKTVYPCEY